LFLGHDHVETILSDKRVAGVKFIGSTAAGKQVASVAGKYMKKGAFELGGSDPFIVLDDADIDLAVEKAIKGRLRNTGQSCTNSKRFIIHEQNYDEFKEKLIMKMKEQVIGDPLDEKTTIGPVAGKKQAETLKKQV